MIVGIVGSEAAKFTADTMQAAKSLITQLLSEPGVTGYCSGHCPLGGIDIWTEQIGDGLKLKPHIRAPKHLSWERGYKPRNIEIAETSAIVHCITLRTLPPEYKGMRFEGCYHCHTNDHVKSGGCWTAWYALRIGKQAKWHIL